MSGNKYRDLLAENGRLRRIVLAVGNNPISPPPWAIEAAIAISEHEERKADGGWDEQKLGLGLDAMVRFFAAAEDKALADQRDGSSINPSEDYKPPKLEQAIRFGLEAMGWDPDDKTNSRRLRRAWNREQLTPQQQDNGIDDHVSRLAGIVETPRIKRVMLELGDTEYSNGIPWSKPSFQYRLKRFMETRRDKKA